MTTSLKTDRSCKHIQKKNKNYTITLTMQFPIILLVATIIGTISFKTYHHTIFWGLTHKNGQNQGKKCSNIHQISFLLNLSLSLAKNPSFCDFKSIFQFSDVTQTDFKLLKIMIKCRKYAQEHHILVVQIHGTYNIWKNNILDALKPIFDHFIK